MWAHFPEQRLVIEPTGPQSPQVNRVHRSTGPQVHRSTGPQSPQVHRSTGPQVHMIPQVHRVHRVHRVHIVHRSTGLQSPKVGPFHLISTHPSLPPLWMRFLEGFLKTGVFFRRVNRKIHAFFVRSLNRVEYLLAI